MEDRELERKELMARGNSKKRGRGKEKREEGEKGRTRITG